jgi:penicillin-binding protein 1C
VNIRFPLRCYFSLIFILGCIILFSAIIFIPRLPLLEKRSFSQAIYDNQHHLLYLTLTDDHQYRLYTPLSQIPPNLVKATLLQEDHYYYLHPGINPAALVKAFITTYLLHQRRIGASTITMQVARMVYKIPTRSITGKAIQIFRALQLESFYSKKQILDAYLNLAPYGGNVQGAGAASLIYFGKPVKTLNFSEILTLAVIPQNPVKRSPVRASSQKLFYARQALYLRWVKKYPVFINQKNIFQLPLPLAYLHQRFFLAPHFITQILLQYPSQKILDTTLNLKLQTIITHISQTYSQTHQLNNYAVLLVDTRSMAVKALVGSADFFNPRIQGQINGTNVKRSPGSALKPFIYALAIQQGLIHPMSILKDAPIHFGLYAPEDFDKDYEGPVNATQALITSRNVPAVALMQQLRPPGFYGFLVQGGVLSLRPESHYGLSLALGGEDITLQEMAALYAALANKGLWKPLRFLETTPQVKGKNLLTPEAAFLVLDMLKSNPRPDPVSTAAVRTTLPVYWKTGTSSRYRDAWAAGIFGPYALVVWAGDFTNKTHQQFVGLDDAAPLFFSIIDAIQAQSPGLQDIFQDASEKLNLVRVKICEASGLLPTPACPKTVYTWFIPGVSPIKRDTVFREVLINSKTGLRECQVSAETKFVVYEFWPSDLAALFESAGIHHPAPPPYYPVCIAQAKTGEGSPPQIISPRENLVYAIHLNTAENRLIPLLAIAEDDVKTIYWFINQTYIGKSAPNHALDWTAKPGKYRLRAVDDHGRSAVILFSAAGVA